MKKKMIKKAVIFAITAGISSVLYVMLQFVALDEGKVDVGSREMPDVVGSRIENDTAYLTVIANMDQIKEKKSFINTVLEMYDKNEFYSTKISTDKNSGVNRLYFSVYLKKGDVAEKKPEFLAEAVLKEGEWEIKSFSSDK